jgi:hypothetical protein
VPIMYIMLSKGDQYASPTARVSSLTESGPSRSHGERPHQPRRHRQLCGTAQPGRKVTAMTRPDDQLPDKPARRTTRIR